MKNLIISLSFLVFSNLNIIAQDTDITQASVSDSQGNRTMMDSNLSASGWDQNRVKEFVNDAANSSMMEILLGNLANERTNSQLIKDFASMMVTEYSNANQKLKTAVNNVKGVNLPSTLDKEFQKKIDNVYEKTGEDFERAYIDMMVEDQKKEIKDFEEAQKNISDPSLKKWVDNTLPILRKHLKKAENIRELIK
ncbi:MAG: DUF4142 domain-containing protein [Bacteroidales bacterium]|nr:DUF4142 domain-containing protein [Bacteroidales bacterium]